MSMVGDISYMTITGVQSLLVSNFSQKHRLSQLSISISLPCLQFPFSWPATPSLTGSFSSWPGHASVKIVWYSEIDLNRCFSLSLSIKMRRAWLSPKSQPRNYQRHPDRNVSKASAFIGNKHSKWWSLSIFPFRSSSAACLHLITFLQMFVPKPSVCFLLMSKMFSHAFQWKCHPFMRRWWNREKTMRNHSKAINNDYATISHIRLSNLNWIYDYV